jgi:hypothetical protein
MIDIHCSLYLVVIINLSIIDLYLFSSISMGFFPLAIDLMTTTLNNVYSQPIIGTIILIAPLIQNFHISFYY